MQANSENGRGNTHRITKRVIDAAKPGEVIWDSDVRGFCVRCRQSGNKTYAVKTRVGGRQRWLTVGRHGSPWTPETARKEALRLLGAIAGDIDPAVIRDADRQNPTVADLTAYFLEEHVRTKLKPSTAEYTRDILERIVNPALGQLRVSDVTRADIARLHHSLRGTPTQANRVVAQLSKLFNWAEQRGYRPDHSNPCHHVDRYPEKKRERFLSEREFARLGDVLTEGERDGTVSPYVAAAIKLLVFTGARRGEILGLEWSNVDFDRGIIRLQESKTGAKTILLSAPALQVLSGIPRQASNPFVICGNRSGAHMVNITKAWHRIRRLAGLEDARIHDIRHSYASTAVAGGMSLLMVGNPPSP